MDPSAFNGSNNLKKIIFSLIKITKIHPFLVYGLTYLEEI